MRKDGKRIDASLVLQMCRHSSDDAAWKLEILDADSNITVCAVVLDAVQFSNLLSTRQATGSGMIWQSPHHGKQHESKTVTVLVPFNAPHNSVHVGDLVRMAQAAEDEAGVGWIVDQETQWNGHRYDPNAHTYRLQARRWV